MQGIYFGKMKMKIQHYLCRIKYNGQKGAICSWVDTLKFISDDQRNENSIKYDRIQKIQKLNGYERLGKILAYLPTLFLASILIYYQSFGLSKFNLLFGFYFSIVVSVIGILLSLRSGIVIYYRDERDISIIAKFTGYKNDVDLLMKVMLGEIRSIPDTLFLINR